MNIKLYDTLCVQVAFGRRDLCRLRTLETKHIIIIMNNDVCSIKIKEITNNNAAENGRLGIPLALCKDRRNENKLQFQHISLQT